MQGIIQIIIVLSIALTVSSINELIEYKFLKKETFGQMIYDTYMRILSGFVSAYTVYFTFSKNLIYVATVVGCVIGKPVIYKVFGQLFKEKDDDKTNSKNKDSPQKENINSINQVGDFNHLLKLCGLINEEESISILEEQKRQKELCIKGLVDKVQKVGEIWVGRSDDINEKLFKQSCVNIILELQKTGDFIIALTEIDKLKEIMNTKNQKESEAIR